MSACDLAHARLRAELCLDADSRSLPHVCCRYARAPPVVDDAVAVVCRARRRSRGRAGLAHARARVQHAAGAGEDSRRAGADPAATGPFWVQVVRTPRTGAHSPAISIETPCRSVVDPVAVSGIPARAAARQVLCSVVACHRSRHRACVRGRCRGHDRTLPIEPGVVRGSVSERPAQVSGCSARSLRSPSPSAKQRLQLRGRAAARSSSRRRDVVAVVIAPVADLDRDGATDDVGQRSGQCARTAREVRRTGTTALRDRVQ